MGKLNVTLCSGLSPIGAGEMAVLLNVSRRTVTNLVTSGGLPELYPKLFDGDVPEWFEPGVGERVRLYVPLEIVVALRGFFGEGRGRPWGLRREWDRGLPEFREWFTETQNGGWQARLLNGVWSYKPTSPAQ